MNSFWNCITLLGLVALMILFAVLNIVTGVGVCGILLGVYLVLFIEAFHRECKDDLTREEIDNARKSNFD